MPMNIQTMLLPHKHVRFGSSLIAIAGSLRQHLQEPRTLDELWALIASEEKSTAIRPTFTQVVLAVDILFSIRQAITSADGRIFLVSDERKITQEPYRHHEGNDK